MLPTVGYCPISLLRPPPARLGSYQCWLLAGHSVPLGHLRIHGCTVLRSILSTYFECPSCFSHCCMKGVHQCVHFCVIYIEHGKCWWVVQISLQSLLGIILPLQVFTLFEMELILVGALHYNLLQMELEVYHYYNSWSPSTSATGKFRVWKGLM